LLRFRPAFNDDNFFEERRIHIASLCRMMELIKSEGTNFLDMTAGKMLAVLREALPLGELAIEPWKTFITTLSDETLLFLLPRIIVSIIPLFDKAQSRELLEHIFCSNRLSITRTALVLWNNDKVKIDEYLPKYCESAVVSKVLSACTSMLKEYSDEVSELALHKILLILRKNDFEDEDSRDMLAANLVPALLHNISTSSSAHSRHLACLIFGKIGAVDPGRIGLLSAHGVRVDRRSKPMVFIDNMGQFLLELTRRASKSFSVMLNADLQEECSYSIQILLRSLFALKDNVGEKLWESLSPQCRREVAMFRFSKFTRTHIRAVSVVERHISDAETKSLFESLYGMVHADAVFARFIMPHLIIVAIIENNAAYIADCVSEMIAVFQNALTHDGWPRFAAHTVFSIIDCLERYRDYRAAKRIHNDDTLTRMSDLIVSVLNAKSEDGTLYCIAAAEKCQCITRALRWCEQYAIKRNGENNEIFNQKQFYTLERLFASLDDVDGVLGAYKMIESRWVSAIKERILALEANGNFWEALPLYEKLENEQMAWIKCLLRLNESRLALNSSYKVPIMNAEAVDEIRAIQLEATWRMQNWSGLEELVDKKPSVSTWGASSASLFCNIKRGNVESMNECINLARLHLIEALSAMTADDSDTYSQAYKYVVHLHILAEIEEAAKELNLIESDHIDSVNLSSLLVKWQKRYPSIMQHTTALEPILTVRRGILHLVKNQNLVQLLLADYELRSGSCSFEDLYIKYKALPHVAEPSEDLYYRVAIFFDNYICLKNGNVNTEKISLILRSYTNVLAQGRSHIFHVMPRMLTVWLDYAEKLDEDADQITTPEFDLNREKDIREINAIIHNAFKRLDLYMFYTVFAQLISRITHRNVEVFSTLKMILSKLLATYPHQCLWQSIAVFRSDPLTQKSRFSRCRAVYELAKRTENFSSLKFLISQYEYVASAFIRVAEDNCSVGNQPSFSKRYPYLSRFFSEGYMDSSIKRDPSILVNEPFESKDRPQIIVPLCEMLQHAVPIEIPNSLSQFPVSAPPDKFKKPFDDSFANVYIHQIDEEFVVIKSMVHPKKITILASDGNRYSLMCKAKDELRKDSRLMDISRMVNTLLRQNAEARQRQLSIRTYSVIPLQDSGGLIEWIPNLNTFQSILAPLMREKCANVMDKKEWFLRWIPNGTDLEKLDRLRGEYYTRNPIICCSETIMQHSLIASLLIRAFTDPCKWYAARLAFIHTSAVMSMLGFVLGLGDRHGENLLIDATNGEAIHVDFNLLFNKGETLAVPEVVPFRLTRNIISGFGVTGVQGAFRYSCETAMRVLRENQEVLQTVLQTFVHDPLLEWMHSEGRAQQLKQITNTSLKRSHSSAAQVQAQEIIRMITLRLKGHVVTPRIYRNTCDLHPMSVEGQVQRLIQLASDELNLARMYIGWCPFL
uniref:Serine/threonine-protein kinase ATR n=1 Tax=Dracunculus medinensis TaxID=318479 RepID=A0A158Q3S9_DRAME